MGVGAFRALYLFFLAGLSGCATVDQYGSRAYDGNLNTQNAINQEVLVNIIRASKYQALSWNPASQLTGGQSESLLTGLPTINVPPWSITNSLTSGVSGGYTTAPLATTAFQAGMLTPVSLKTVATLMSYYPREVVFYALISAIDVKLVSSNHVYARLINDPGWAYSDRNKSSDLDQTKCDGLLKPGLQTFFGDGCSYERFTNLLGVLIDSGLYVDLIQEPAQQPAQAQANQSNIVTVGRFCFDEPLTPESLLLTAASSDLHKCGIVTPQPLGGTVQVTKTETHKLDDKIINTDTKSSTKTIITTTTSVLPIGGRSFKVRFDRIGEVELVFEMRSPNGFLGYLGSWYRVGDLPFGGYDSIPAQRIFGTEGSGPYLSILDVSETSAPCYSLVNYERRTYCVPVDATHTSMLMDIAVILRNLNISPTDLNAPISVRVAN